MDRLLIFAFILFISVIAQACKNNVPLPYPEPDSLDEEVANIIQPMGDNKITVGAAVGIIKPGGEKKMYFFGEKNKGEDDLADENTLFEIGSITKTMTTALLADMYLKGEVNLNDPVENYLPDVTNFPDYNGEKITFQHLANHTSSLPRLPDNLFKGNIDFDQPYLHYTEEKLYEFLNAYSLMRPIGSVDEYSNLGVGLLGYTLAKIRGTSLAEQYQNVVFSRVGMPNTCITIPEDYTNLAQPHNGRRKAVPMWDLPETMLGAGGIKASLKDMLSYLEANMGYGGSDLKDVLALGHKNTQTLNPNMGVGLAWINLVQSNGDILTWHNGGTAGTIAFIGFVKELDMGVVLLFNTAIEERTKETSSEIWRGVEIMEAMKKYANE